MKRQIMLVNGLEELFEERFKHFFFKERFKVLSSGQKYLPRFTYKIGEGVQEFDRARIGIQGDFDRKYTIIDVIPQKNIQTNQLVFFDNINLEYNNIIEAYILKYPTKRENHHVLNNVQELYNIPRDLEEVEKAIKINVLGPFNDVRKQYIAKEYYDYLGLIKN